MSEPTTSRTTPETVSAAVPEDDASAILAAFMQHMPGLAWMKDEDGRYIFVNDQAIEAFGRTREEILGRTDTELFPPSVAAEFTSNDRLALDRQKLETIEHLEDGEGTLRHSVVSKFPIRLGGRVIVGGVGVDITEQTLARKNQEFLFSVAEKIRAARNVPDLLAELASTIGGHLGLHRCLFNEIDLEKDTEIVHRDFSRDGDSVAGVHKVSAYSPASSKTMEAGQTVVNYDSRTDPRTASLFDTVYGPNKEIAYVTVPMMRGGQWVASLWCSDDKPRRWTDQEVALLEDIAERTWAAVERVRAESWIRESEERFSKAFNASPLVLTISSLESGKLLEVNETFVNVTGYSREEAIGKTTLDLGLWADPDDREIEMDLVRKAGQLSNAEYVFRTRTGREIVGLVAAERIVIGGETCALTVIQDITERKRAEGALRESEQRFRVISDAAPVLIWMSDVTKGYFWVNKPWLEFTGRTLEQVAGDGWMEHLHPGDIDRCAGIYAKAFEAREPFTTEFRLQKEDGEYRWLLNRAVPRFSAGGDFLGYIGSCVDINDRRTMENALRRSEERLQLAQEAGKVGIWDWDVVAGKTFWSDQMWEFYGHEPGAAEPDDEFWLKHLDPADRDRVYKNWKAALSSDAGEYKDEYRIADGEAQTRWLQVTATIQRDGNGKPTRVYGVNLDISERKAIELRLTSSETQLRTITDSLPALVSYIGRDERYKFANHQYTQWFGVPREEIVGKTMLEVVGPQAYEELKPSVEAVLAGKRLSFNTWLNYKVAGERFVHISYVPDLDTAGGVAGYYALVSDLTELKRSEDMLRSSEDRMRILSESFTDYAIISMNKDGLIESWNPGAINIFGYSDDEIIGQPSAVLFTPEDVKKGVHEQEMRNARRTGRAVDERWHVRKDGSRFFASGVMAPLHVGRKLTGYAKIAADLTERKRNAEALQRAYDEMEMRVLERTRELASANETLVREMNERKSAERQKIDLLKRLVSSQEEERRRIARDLHDHLGQRLTALRLKLASLREATAGHKDFHERTTRLQQIAELIDSEVSFLAWELRPSALDELGLMEATETFVKEWARHYEMKAEFHSSGLNDLRLDREIETHLYRITQEALNNIIKHADASTVNVLAERMGESVVLIIEDNGRGFKSDKASALPKGSGGLGLAGMRERAELIGGTLDIESNPEEGTTIYVRVPIVNMAKKKKGK